MELVEEKDEKTHDEWHVREEGDLPVVAGVDVVDSLFETYDSIERS